jgi:hypothetical protein
VADTQTRIETDVLAIDEQVMRSTGSERFGITEEGFVPKSFARLLAEKLALARAVFDDAVDLGSGSAIRKLLELSALEDARTWAALATAYDNAFAVSATGEALSRLGQELGLGRPHLEATGAVTLRLTGTLPAGVTQIGIERGSRLLTSGGHHAATAESVVLTPAAPAQSVSVVAFYPGPEHNLDPAAAGAGGTFPQKLDRWNPADHKLEPLFDLVDSSANAFEVKVEHTQPLAGGELYWPDDRYRQLLLRAPRSTWTADAIEVAVSLVPGVRRVQVRDAWGGLDINQSIFGNFNFVQRGFGSERDLGSRYYLTILVAPTEAAIWEGPDGLRAQVESVIEDLRPISIFPNIQEAEEVGIGISGNLVVQGLALPTGSTATVNASQAAVDLKKRLLKRLQLYVDTLGFGEPVRAAEAIWALMNEPGIVDVQEPRLLRYPPGFDAVDFTLGAGARPEQFPSGENVELQANQVPRFVDDPSRLVIV